MNNLFDPHKRVIFWSSPDKEEKFEAVKEKVIGAGTFGRCELIRDIHTNKYFALKACRLTQFDVLSSAIVEFEKSINFNYKHLVYSYFSWYDGAGQLQLITEYCQLGSINQVLDQQKDITPEGRIGLAYAVVVQVNRALKYLKEQQPPIFHRDIKFENVLIDGNGIVKLADLGLAATHDMGQTHTQGAGTPRWLAPEVLNGREYDYPSDQYSLALVALRILQGVVKNAGEIYVPPECQDDLLMEYLNQQLATDPTKRMTAEEVLAKFKGKGSSTRGFIRLPPAKDRIISPDEIPWHQTTEDERRANDELRRLALMFSASLDDEKDIAVIAETLKLLPFTGTWTTKRGIAISRSPEGTVSLPKGVLGPTAPQTPFKAAFMKNIHGRERDEDSSSGDRPRASGTAPVNRRLLAKNEDAEEDEEDSDSVAPTKKLSFATKEPRRRLEPQESPPSSKPAKTKSAARASSNVSAPKRGGRRFRDSNVDEDDDVEPETPTKKLSVKVAPPRRAASKLAARRASTLADDDDEPEEPEDDDDDAMDVDEDGATSEFEDDEEDGEEEDPHESKSASRAKKASAAPVSRRSSKLNAQESAPAPAPLAARRPLRAAAVSKDGRRKAPTRRRASVVGISLEDEMANWDTYSVEERVDKIMASEQWKTTLEEMSKIRRLIIPEEDEIRAMFHSVLSQDIGEREWVKGYENSSFAKRLWEWAIDTHGLYRENGRGKKRKRI